VGNKAVVVLVVEDMQMWQDIWREHLEAMGVSAEMVGACTIEEARRLFTERQSDIDIILMDACVPGDYPNTHGLVAEFRRSFGGPMVAISSLPEYRAEIVAAGCDREADGKHKVPHLVRDLVVELTT